MAANLLWEMIIPRRGERQSTSANLLSKDRVGRRSKETCHIVQEEERTKIAFSSKNEGEQIG